MTAYENETFTVIDLLDIRESLGSHWNAREKDSYEGRCAQCREAVSQSQNRCEYCGTIVVWKNSRVWRRLYGAPHIVEKQLLSTPREPLGKWLCAKAGVKRFPNPHSLRRWKSALANLDEHTIRGIVDYCELSLKRRNLNMRGLITFTLNTADQKIRALPEEDFDEEELGELDVEIYGEEE